MHTNHINYEFGVIIYLVIDDFATIIKSFSFLRVLVSMKYVFESLFSFLIIFLSSI